MKASLITLFPEAVGIYPNIPITEKDDATLLGVTRYVKNPYNLISEDYQVLDKTPELAKMFNQCVKDFVISTYNPTNDIEFPITQSWLNVTRKEEFHHTHFHPNSFISGVFYLQTIPNDRLNFQKADNTFTSLFNIKEYNDLSAELKWVTVKKHDLLLFRSSLLHGVPKNTTNVDRISLSFNTWVSGKIGNTGKRTEVHSAGIQ